MKIIAPPQINGAAELLDLLSHPKKFQDYLKQLQDMHAAINAKLGDLDTREKAENLLSVANARMEEIEAKEARLAERESLLAAAQARLSEKVARLRAIASE